VAGIGAVRAQESAAKAAKKAGPGGKRVGD
jgi:hypothetical protein